MKTKDALVTADKTLDAIDFQKDTFGISSAALLKECDRIQCLLDVERNRFVNISDSGILNVELSATVDTLVNKVTTKLSNLRSDAIELKNFEHFMSESTDIVESINYLKSLVTSDEIDVRNLARKINEHENLKFALNTLESLKHKTDERGSFFLEDCHFASTQISDQLDQTDSAWQELQRSFEVREEKLKSSSVHQELKSQCVDLQEALTRLNRKVAHEPVINSLSSSKNAFNESKLTASEISLQLEKCHNLIDECHKTHNEDLLEESQLLQKQLVSCQERCRSKNRFHQNQCQFHNFLIQAHMEDSWIKEKIVLLDSLKTPSSSTEAESVRKSLNVLQQQIDAHKTCLQTVLDSGNICLNNDVENSSKVESKLSDTNKLWVELKTKLNEKLVSSVNQQNALKYLDIAEDHIQYLDNKLVVAMNNQYGTDLNSSEIALEKHKKMKASIHLCKKEIKQFVRESNNFTPEHSHEIKSKANTIKIKFKKLEQAFNHREKNLENTHSLFSLYADADSVKHLFMDVSKQIPDESLGRTYEESVVSSDRFKRVQQCFDCAAIPYDKFNALCDHLVANQHPHSASIAKLKAKIETMYQRLSSKIDSRSKKMEKNLQYQTFTNQVSNAVAILDEINKKLCHFETKHGQLESVSALREELREIEHTINDTIHLKEQIKNLIEQFKVLSGQFPGKNIQKLNGHLKNLKTHYGESNRSLRELQLKYKAKIGNKTFDSDVQYLKGWYVSAVEELALCQGSAVDFRSAKSSHTQIELKCKEISLKKRSIDDLQSTMQAMTAIEPSQVEKVR